MRDEIFITPACTDRLHGISLTLKKGGINLITGQSGCGKTSLAVNIIAAAGMWRIKQLARMRGLRPNIEGAALPSAAIHNMPPTILLDGKRFLAGSRTIADALGFARLLKETAAKDGVQLCSICGGSTILRSPEELCELAAAEFAAGSVVVKAIYRSSKRTQIGTELLKLAGSRGFSCITIDGADFLIDEINAENPSIGDLQNASSAAVKVDEFSSTTGRTARLKESIREALDLGLGGISILRPCDGREMLFSPPCSCAACGTSAPDLTSLSLNRTLADLCGKHTPGNAQASESSGSAVEPLPLSARVGTLELEWLFLRKIHELTELTSAVEGTTAQQMYQLHIFFLTLCRAGLGQYCLTESLKNLSEDELVRLDTANAALAAVSGALYVTDEPFRKLHPTEISDLMTLFTELRASGNTILLTGRADFIEQAVDNVFELSSVEGRSACDRQLALPDSSRERYIAAEKTLPSRILTLTGTAYAPSEIPIGGLTVVAGRESAALFKDICSMLNPAIAEVCSSEDVQYGTGELVRVGSASHGKRINKLRVIRAESGRAGPYATVATYTGIFDELRCFYSGLKLARLRGYTPAAFSFAGRSAAQSGRCRWCKGRGYKDSLLCPSCSGSRFEANVRQVRYQGLAISDLMQLSVVEALQIIGALPRCAPILRDLIALGLEQLPLGQAVDTLSGGERIRLELAAVARTAARPSIYLLEHPTSFLDRTNSLTVVRFLRLLTQQDNYIIAISNDPVMWKFADHLVEITRQSTSCGKSA